MYKGLRVCAIIAAAGKGRRMESKVEKQYLMLKDKPLLVHTLEVFSCCDAVDDIVIVTGSDHVKYCEKDIVSKYNIKKVLNITAGGKERQESVKNGLEVIKEFCDIVIIHDGARPFVTSEIINRSIANAYEFGAAACAVLVKDTIKMSDDNGFVAKTLDRSKLYAIQTPQSFMFDIIYDAHKKAEDTGFIGTDDTVLAEMCGRRVKLFEGSYENIKVTTREDLYFGEAIIDSRKGSNSY